MRQYIKRSAKEQLVSISIFDSHSIDENRRVLDECKTLYEKMFSDKGMDIEFNEMLAKKYIEQNALTIAVAYDSTTQLPLGFSAIIHEGVNARLWLAAFDFRNETLDSQVLSRAHQRLDWELICWCKQNGVCLFDFGGVNSFEEPNGIAQFKMKFEDKNRVTYTNYLVPKNIIGKLALRFYLRNR